MAKWGVVLLAGLATPATAAPPGDANAVVALLRDQDGAVLRVGERIAVRARPLCAAAGWSAGMAVQRLDQYGADYRPAARDMLKIGDRPTVAALAPDSAAAAAGLAVGDQIAAIDGHGFAESPARRAAGNYAGIVAAMDAIDAALADGRADVTVLRGGKPITVALTARPACRARFEVRAGRSANASSDGYTVQVASDLMNDARDDGELAAILAHELAHSLLDHPRRLKAREPGLSVRATEIQADRLSVYLLDSAGYGAAGAVSFWSRWGRAHDLGILSDRTHPGWEKRVASIAQEAAAITAAQRAGEPVKVPPDLTYRR